jgi:hypothetical protein
MSTEAEAAEVARPATEQAPTTEAVTAEVNFGDPLSPIAEGPDEDAASEISLLVYDTNDEELVKHG